MQASIVLVVGVGLGYLLKLYIFPKHLQPSEIGLLTVMIDAANLLSALIPLGSQHIFMRYKPYFEKEPGKREGLFFIGVVLSLIGLIPFLILFFGFKNSLIQYFQKDTGLLAQYFIFLLPLVFARLLFRLSMDFSKASKKLVFPLFLKEILSRLLLGALILLYAQSILNLDRLMMGYVTIYFIIGAIMFYYLVKFVKADVKPKREKLQGKMAKEVVTFGLFTVLTSAGTIIIKNIDSIMITTILNLEKAGIYSIAFFIGLIIELPRRALSQSVAPHLAKSFSNHNFREIKDFYQKTSINQLTLALFIFLCIWINIDSLFALIPNGNTYADGKYVVLFIALAYIFDVGAGSNAAIIQNSPFYRYNFFIMGLMAALFIGSNLLLIPKFGINGAALATLISYFLINVIRAIIIWLHFRIQPFTKTSLWLILGGLILYLLFQYITLPWPPIQKIAIQLTLITFVYWIFILRFNIAPDLKKLIYSILRYK